MKLAANRVRQISSSDILVPGLDFGHPGRHRLRGLLTRDRSLRARHIRTVARHAEQKPSAIR